MRREILGSSISLLFAACFRHRIALLITILAIALTPVRIISASPREAPFSTEPSQATLPFAATSYAPYNTPPGAEVRVDLEGGNFLVFSQVDVVGNTSAKRLADPDVSDFFPLSGTGVEISTTAYYRGGVRISMAYGGRELPCPEENLRIMQLKEGSWEDITVWMDSGSKLLTAETQSLGFFAVGWVSEEEGTCFYFPEGYEGERVHDFLVVESLSRSPAALTVRYLLPGKPTITRNYTVPPGCKLSINLDGREEEGASLRMVSSQPLQAQRHIYFGYVDLVQTDSYPLAESAGLAILSPLRSKDTLGIMFHQASTRDIHNQPVRTSVMIPFGRCISDANPWGRYPGWTPQLKGNPGYWIEQPRGRGTYSTSAVDVGGKAGCSVYSPVDGVVESIEYYSLYGTFPDVRVSIIPDGYPELRVVLTHIDGLKIKPGDHVWAGTTYLAVIRPLHLYFRSDIGRDYTGEEGDHVHLQVNLANGG